MTQRPLRLYFVVGEISGDALGADLVEQFKALGTPVEAMGLGGPKLQACGLKPLFDSSEIAVMGLSGVVARLPALLARAKRVAQDILERRPDVLLLIDSPEFSKQVAKRVKARRPDLPVVKYVCPTVWSWRPGRAKSMTSYVDHVLAILPFEPDVMAELGGPPTTYVGHPLSRLAGTVDLGTKRKPANPPQILLLPGSRKSESSRLMPVLRESVDVLHRRGLKASYVLPAVPHLEAEIRRQVTDWNIKPEVVCGEEAKAEAMQSADAAIAASGTALLELAMFGVPSVSIYKLDKAIYALRFMIKGWTAALPNLIADSPVVPERFNEYANPEYIARLVEPLLEDTLPRQAQLAGFKLVHARMKQDEAPGRICARIIEGLAQPGGKPSK
ncbi:lipid-A-disaccharide synthase [Salaquimonas pukyongi]|uniref:lipid-A-disaccharide synthase n=1 Tax=Salaquimonas pukyongi TaxID=2712698 RepID=UPI00096B9C5E|nr:lipid-A-disaccharide synthase [Salaquimonas pukyongi]